MAAYVFGSAPHHEVLDVVGKQDPPGTYVPTSVSDFLTYLSKTSWPDAWQWAVQVNHLLQRLAREQILVETTSSSIKDPLFSRSYLLMSGLTKAQARGHLWMAPALGPGLIVDQVQASLIHLTGKSVDGDEWGGTGLALSSRHILTARHVIDDMKLDASFAVPQSDGGAAIANVAEVHKHDKQDLAVVRVDEDVPLVPAPGLVSRDPEWSDPIFLLGYPPIATIATAAVSVQAGEVVNPSVATYFGEDLFLYSAVARPGNSGGPVLGRDGRLLGMVIKELAHEVEGRAPVPFYAGLPARVVHTCLAELGLPDILSFETWD